ncbi:hypothetical protein EDB85DRAFT_1890526 [Lactarius pseudohatsudake]|nr:hypothetical protein EDB85DRAFT_1890526 [Lactarius pseudohatsudake]
MVEVEEVALWFAVEAGAGRKRRATKRGTHRTEETQHDPVTHSTRLAPLLNAGTRGTARKETLLKAGGRIPKENVGLILMCSPRRRDRKSKQGGTLSTVVCAATWARHGSGVMAHTGPGCGQLEGHDTMRHAELESGSSTEALFLVPESGNPTLVHRRISAELARARCNGDSEIGARTELVFAPEMDSREYAGVLDARNLLGVIVAKIGMPMCTPIRRASCVNLN